MEGIHNTWLSSDAIPRVSVILSTYNQPLWLEKVLWGYGVQLFRDFEVVVADDGSGEATRALIAKYQAEMPYPIRHVWHEDDGFRKCVILNRAIEASRGEYLVFSDGDCIPRADFLQVHWALRSRRSFVSGGAVRLPMGVSKAIDREAIESQQAFSTSYLNGLDMEKVRSCKLTHSRLLAKLLNRLTTSKPTWNGNNTSCYRNLVVATGGYDERMGYGGEDRELGERLCNAGLHGCRARYLAILLHLDHSRGYVTEEMWAKNNAIRKETRNQRLTRTEWGIKDTSIGQNI
ncbi:MAG: glycosyltransferase family 2 protein [Bacteroides sp.]